MAKDKAPTADERLDYLGDFLASTTGINPWQRMQEEAEATAEAEAAAKEAEESE
ncbi:MAG TPA: hypothetical protein VIV56_02910 [Gemmatimonadales bacterium]